MAAGFYRCQPQLTHQRPDHHHLTGYIVEWQTEQCGVSCFQSEKTAMGIGSWITSALESNVGLDAIAQLTADIYGSAIRMPQGLGTGQLFTDNIPMPLTIKGDKLWRCR